MDRISISGKRQMMKKSIFFLLYFLSPLLPIAAIYNSNPAYYGGIGKIPMILGSIAYTWLNAQLVISARPKLLESVFGLDRVFRFHSIMPSIAIVASIIHKLLKDDMYEGKFKTSIGDAALVIFIVTSVLALVFLIDTLVRIIKPMKYLTKIAGNIYVGKYNVQKILHNITVAAVVFIFVHVMLSYSARNIYVKSVYILYFAAAMAFYLYHKVVRRYFLSKRFLVEKVAKDSDTMFTLTLKPANGKMFRYKPGQFGFLRIQSKGISGEEHPFSISSQPANKEFITMTVKNLGDWSATVGNIKPGSKAIIDAPYGRFNPALYPCEAGIVLIAGGVGITPMLSILRDFYLNRRDQKVMLIWGVNTRSERICNDEFDAFERDMKNFVLVPVIAREPDYDGEKGFVTDDLIDRVLTAHGFAIAEQQYFVCGPAIMQNGILKILRAKGIRNKQIHYESFSL
jgi:predicted ferric reductase